MSDSWKNTVNMIRDGLQQKKSKAHESYKPLYDRERAQAAVSNSRAKLNEVLARIGFEEHINAAFPNAPQSDLPYQPSDNDRQLA